MVSKMNINNSDNNSNNDNNKLDNWREYFRKSNSNIFEIIEHAIKVAASDSPNEYKLRKSNIAELLFSVRKVKCLGCDRVELAVSDDVSLVSGGHGHDHALGGLDGHGHDDEGDVGNDVNDAEVDIEGNDARKTELGTGLVNANVDVNVNVNAGGSNFSYKDAETLTDLIEEEAQVVKEVLRIRDVLYNSHDESDSVLFESLRRLELMDLTVIMLKDTEIGKAVNSVRKHSSKEIRQLARTLIDGWKVIVDEWVKCSQEQKEQKEQKEQTVEGNTPDSINPSTIDEEEGLPFEEGFPPLEDGVFFCTQTMDFDQIFDGIDDDGNPRNSGEFNEIRKPSGKPSAVKPDAPKRREPPKQVTSVSKDNRAQQMKVQPPLPKISKHSDTQSGRGRPLLTNGDVKLSKESKIRPRLEKPAVQRRPAPQPDKLKPSNEDSVQDKLAATKRKLQERYQQVDNAKRQRTIQVMEIHDLPKQGVVNKNPHGKFGNQNHRHWANGRK